MFPRKKKTGSDLIQEAIGQFEDIASRIDAGVKDNTDRVAANKSMIDALSVENDGLIAVAVRGGKVAGKLRELIS